jgi:uncharacterized protein
VKRTLRVSADLSLPVDVAGEAIAILAKRGAGKTHTAAVLVEELYAAGVQVVILDPVRAWWGLRTSSDGKGAGLPIAIIGGPHGDVPLEPTAGALIADVAVDTGQSLVVDIREFSKTQMRRFVTQFAEQLYRRKGADSSLLHLVLEEADVFAPQKVTGADAEMQSAIEAIVRRGRGSGLGITMITQRSAVLSKDVLEQADVLIAMRMTGPNDRKAIEGWVGKHAESGEERVLPSLPGLRTGEAWVWNPERDILQRVKIRARHTFDVAPTGGAQREPKAAAPIDLEKLGEQIAGTVERARENDPAELRRRIRSLEGDLAKAAAAPAPSQPVEVPVEVRVPVLEPGEIDKLKKLAAEAMDVAEHGMKLAQELVAGSSRVNDALTAAIELATGKRPAPQPAARQPAPPPPTRPRPNPPPAGGGGGADDSNTFKRTTGGGTDDLSSSQQAILDALLWFETIGIEQPSRPALAFIAGSRPTSGGFKNNLGALKNDKGVYDWPPLIAYPKDRHVQLTDDGRARAAMPNVDPTPEGIQQAVLDRLPGSQAAIVRALIPRYPHAVSREELAAEVGVPTTSGGYKNNLGALRTLEVIDYPQQGHVVARPILFLE